MTALQAGVAAATITPPVGIRMAGYAARNHGAEGIHDPLAAKALVLQHGTTRAVLVTADLCWIPQEQMESIRERIGAACDLPAAQVLVNVSHTHSGPILEGEELERRNAAWLADQLVATAGWAATRLVPVQADWGRAPVQIGANRRERRPDGSISIGVNWDGSVLPHVDLIRFTAEGKPVAVLFAHACHPTTVTSENYLISADYPGVAQRLIEGELGCPALFLQGCSGDIAPYPRPGWDHLERNGRRLAYATLKLSTELTEPRDIETLRSEQRSFLAPLDPPPSLPAARAHLAACEATVGEHTAADPDVGVPYWVGRERDWAAETMAAIEEDRVPDGYACDVQLLALDDCAILALQNEVLSPLSRRIDHDSPYAQTTVLGYSNGGRGYYPDASVWVDQGYEHQARIRVAGLPLAEAAGDALVSAGLALLRGE